MQPTPVPTMTGETNLDLWEYKDELLFQLKQCNRDKADLLEWAKQTTKEPRP